MRELGFDPDAVRAGRAELTPDNVQAYLELHIEQGPVLDTEEIPMGIVTALPGNRRIRLGHHPRRVEPLRRHATPLPA